MRILCFVIFTLHFLMACSGNSANNNASIFDNTSTQKNTNLSIPDNRYSNTYKILIFGNSHVIGLDELLSVLINNGNPAAEIEIYNAAGGFLDNRSTRTARNKVLESKPWTHVILQGQKYSQSGAYRYPTTQTRIWIDKTKNLDATPILFPEHPQRGRTKEAAQVHRIHTGIAKLQKSCIAPVGLAWDKAIIEDPEIPLHSSDGNHASELGLLLTAYVFYEVITGESATLLPFIEEIIANQETQSFLRRMASKTIELNQPCNFAI
ncbi:hypothetical protein [uncultured Psychrosphaera sp.]|uniref:hypothetical protein n=1 Tax=uncultured Psychrosphaera sp. TaxID=1403522 RepID=UPI0030FB6B2D